jgi:hypothetical protein
MGKRIWQPVVSTIDSRYYDTDGIRKMYQYNQTIGITSLNFYCLGMAGIQIWYRKKQYFVVTGIIITSLLYIVQDPIASDMRSNNTTHNNR